jgi:hypothetical protein
MSEIKHTPDPWRTTELDRVIADTIQKVNDDYFIADCFGPDAKANARRIVACVNACAGLSQDALDGGWKAVEIIAYSRSLEQQRDQLLDALKGVLKCARGSSGRIIIDQYDEEEINRAIAAVEQSK